ncbi:MAG TPA: hypothetical protein ENH37_02135 [Deltaproteobacteria bacterium]|nr:hypothetical protein [Deltaproteobacteria bacterium]
MKQTNYIKIFIKSNRKEIRFFLLFISLFVALQALHYVVYPATVPLFVHKLNAEASSAIINIITPEERSFVEGERSIRSGSFRVRIIGGCEGTEGMLLLVAAMWAFEMSIKRKILGSLIGCFVVYLANLIRIVVLYYCLKYKPDLFDLVHIYIGQILIIFIALIFFIAWAGKFAGTDGKLFNKA